MTKTFIKGALVAAVALVATPAFAAPTPFTATAVIQKPLSVSKARDLDFGTTTMNPSLVSDTVTVGKTSAAVAVCGSSQLTCSGGASAQFDLTGVGTNTVSLNYGIVPTTLSNGTDTVAFSLDAPSSVALAAGVATFYVGGQITVASATKPGTYTNNLSVTATYQ